MFNFLCNSQIHAVVLLSIQVWVYCLSRVSVLSVPTIPQSTVYGRQLPLSHLRDNFDILLN